MLSALKPIDRLSEFVGKTAGWSIVVLTLFISAEVFSRYVLRQPHAWATDVQIMLYGTLIMLGGAYTLSRNGHVRADLIYSALSPRRQAAIDLTLYLVFFFPGVLALLYAGFQFTWQSWAIGERSSTVAGGPPLFPFKAMIPAAGLLLTLQGIAEVFRCALCLSRGAWPAKEGDVREVDVEKIKNYLGEKSE